MSRLKDTDDFGNRMKNYEAAETGRRFDVTLPVYARIDGRAFSGFTRGMARPFDIRMTMAMIKTTKHLVQHPHARMGYVQSDEISLVWQADGEDSDIFFSGKTQKMASVLASLAAAKFATVCPEGFADRLPHFDCRVFQLPSRTEAANAFLWRAMDCKKNAIAMVAQSLFSAKQLHGKRQADMHKMVAEAGVVFDCYPVAFRLGTFLHRETSARLLTAEELARVPEKHRPDGPVLRTSVEAVDMPEFHKVTNREAVIFEGAIPAIDIPHTPA